MYFNTRLKNLFEIKEEKELSFFENIQKTKIIPLRIFHTTVIGRLLGLPRTFFRTFPTPTKPNILSKIGTMELLMSETPWERGVHKTRFSLLPGN